MALVVPSRGVVVNRHIQSMGQHAVILKEVYKGWGVAPIDFKRES